MSETNISNTEAITLDTDERRTLMNASSMKAVAGEITWPVTISVKTVKNVAVGPEVNEKHSITDSKALFFRITQTSFL